MKPKFTDAHKFGPTGYIKAAKTDIAATFRRIRREMAEQEKAEQEKAEQEAMQNVKQIKRRQA